MNLVIVESPTKARKLKTYLDNDFTVEASVGHIRDLPKSGLGVDVENNFEPTYVVSEGKKEVVAKLQRLAKKASKIYLATDPDREGEAIAWHITQLLDDTVPDSALERATFNEITKSAVLAAIQKPSKIRFKLVDAQQARRVVDRLVGYQVSPVLWKKVRRGLSAGRVQSVALRLIVEKEREIEAFKPDEYWEVDVALAIDASAKAKSIFKDGKPLDPLPGGTLVSRVFEVGSEKYEPSSEADVTPVMSLLEATGTSYSIRSLEQKERKRSSLPPFTTSTLQQAAANRLGMTSKQSMRLAQHLYEEGLITYHRTDSMNLSQQSLSMARSYIKDRYGEQYLPQQARVFRSKAKNAQEAHEAIRITDINVREDSIMSLGKKFTSRHAQLYDLIWRRFVASQMETAVYNQTTLLVDAENNTTEVSQATLKTTGSILKFDGWMKLFPAGGDTILPEVTKGQQLGYLDTQALQKFTQPPARYNDASLVKELEKRGIGRPSTYASIISVIVDRGYVVREDKRFAPTPVGTTVCDFLVKHFKDIMDYDFTAEMEEDLDRIARGEKAWRKIVKEFYDPLAKIIESVTEKADRVQIPVEETGEDCPTCAEKIATGELTKKEQGQVVIRSGRYGKFKSCSRFPECDYTENMVEKLEGRHCPLCKKGDIVLKPSRWGKSFYGCGRYPECDWASWKEPEKDLKLTQTEWDRMKAEREARKKERAAKRAGGASKKKGAKKTKRGTTKRSKSAAKKA